MDYFQQAARLCAAREYCASDVRAKLRTKGCETEEITEIISRLEREGYLNEARYARAFAADKFRFSGWGKVKIAYQLRLKAVSSAAISEALDAIPAEEYEAAARRFIATKLGRNESSESYAVRQKAARSALTRGYETDLVRRILEL